MITGKLIVLSDEETFDNIYTKMDAECVSLCKAVNSLKGIQTIESCCGHKKNAFRIYLITESIEYLPDLLYHFDSCHNGFSGWEVYIRTDCAKSYPIFRIEKDIKSSGDAYKEAESIAENILNDIQKRGRVSRK